MTSLAINKKYEEKCYFKVTNAYLIASKWKPYSEGK